MFSCLRRSDRRESDGMVHVCSRQPAHENLPLTDILAAHGWPMPTSAAPSDFSADLVI